VNQIEIWFGILQRRVIRFGDFRTAAELERRLLSFIRHWNRYDAHPLRWTFRGRFDQHHRPRLAFPSRLRPRRLSVLPWPPSTTAGYAKYRLQLNLRIFFLILWIE
jgi:hypothetical protein